MKPNTVCFAAVVALAAASYGQTPATPKPTAMDRIAKLETQVADLKKQLADLQANSDVASLKQQLAALQARVDAMPKAQATPPAAAAARPAGGATPAALPSDATDLKVEFVKIEDADFGKKLTFKITNTSGKDIDSIKGGIQPLDQFGDPFERFQSELGVELDKPIKAGQTTTTSGIWPTANHRMLELLQSSPSKVSFKWDTDKVQYVGG